MRGIYKETIWAICATLVQDYRGARQDFDPGFMTRFVLAQEKKMGDLFRLPFRLLNFTFVCHSLLTHGTFFHRLSREEKRRQISIWRRSGVAICRDFIRFYEGFTVFALHSPKSILSSLEKDLGL